MKWSPSEIPPAKYPPHESLPHPRRGPRPRRPGSSRCCRGVVWLRCRIVVLCTCAVSRHPMPRAVPTPKGRCGGRVPRPRCPGGRHRRGDRLRVPRGPASLRTFPFGPRARPRSPAAAPGLRSLAACPDLCPPPPPPVPRVQRIPCSTNISGRAVIYWDPMNSGPGVRDRIGYRTACPTNAPVRTGFYEGFTVRWTRGMGGGGVHTGLGRGGVCLAMWTWTWSGMVRLWGGPCSGGPVQEAHGSGRADGHSGPPRSTFGHGLAEQPP